MEVNSVTYDLLKSIHSEMKIAVQNHQLLVLRKKMCPTDPDVENHINVTQGLIISLGRSQAELLTQLRKEPCFSELKHRLLNSPNFLPKGVPYPYSSKHVPMLRYNGATGGNNIEKDKKIGYIKYNRKEAIIQIPKGIQQSLLKIKGGKTPTKKDLDQKILDGTKIKLVYNKKHDEQSILKNPKKQMSVLKSKNDKGKEATSNSDDNNEKYINEKSDCLSPQDENSQTKSDLSAVSPSSTTNGDGKVMKTSPSRSNSHSDESEVNDQERTSIINQEIKLVKKYDTRFLRKKKYSALLPAVIKKSTIKTDVESKDKVDADSSGNEANEIKPLRPEDLGQELFLSYFGLVSKAKGDVLKRKRCERKRRSVAGQSSLYSDYYQPVSSKRTYAKKATSTPTSPTNQVIVETAIELDDEDEKPKYCMVCSETGVMDICQSCSGTYHEKCKPDTSIGCPNCSLQATDINNIVGANFFGSPSSYEIIKRYSVTGNDTNETNQDDKGQKPNESKEIMV